MERMGRIPSGCAVFGVLNQDGRRVSGEMILRAMAVMHERSNGLGGGFAGYGIYPEFAELYAFHVLYDDPYRFAELEEYLKKRFVLEKKEPLPVRKTRVISAHPLFVRYFLRPRGTWENEEDEVVRIVMDVNAHFPGAYIVSSGKNMGIFKGVGYPEDIGTFFRLEEYEGYCWIAHGRFPTNTPGWWGGAHPFGLLSFAVVHNGEISSYGINRRYLENFGYRCTLQTDTEVIVYLVDLLVRKHRIPVEWLGAIFAAPFWEHIDALHEPQRTFFRALRITYGGALLNGPFSIIVGFPGGMFGMVDRIKLRPMVAAWRKETFYLSSEESAIREVEPNLDRVVALRAGEVIVGRVGEKVAYGQELAISRV
ncbi:MAG: glutamine amidotransferase family protein [Candidatus Caldatribacterium sp.]|uniref:class II glutamine amidotransferase n=1 Tax=Candidatus Caldatribacterium sp. TaxID=2282143 RepID=UPI00299C04A2|nr:glutamine amidotransferase family protein [Candidatus Caldatribacterium sp.]MCX7730853.1 glutamine amidotransferase family protein [Candidatus Caldatribacterium sp.]MDW8081745.1 glutamine amidotransferase family protein [Candidatus Calescibacterium sp.]